MATQDEDNCSAELAVFQAYVDLINSERETNWARNNALLVANSLILGAMIASPTGLTGERGLHCRTARRLGSSSPWSGGRSRLPDGTCSIGASRSTAATLSSPCFTQLPNPFSKGASHHQMRGAIFILTLFMISVFALIYRSAI